MYFSRKQRWVIQLLITFFSLVGAQVSAYAEDVRLAWSPSPDVDVAGYKIYYGPAAKTYSSSLNVGNTTNYTISGLSTGTYYFAVTAYDLSGNESAFSNEASKSVTSSTPPPSTPPISGGVLLVDFGKTSAADSFGLSGWTTVIRDVYTDNRDLGPGGVTIVVGDNQSYTYHGVSGPARLFASDERIVVTWYNNSAAAITFRPAISFTDSNRRYADPVGVWYDMNSVTIPAFGTVQSSFDVASTSGTFSLVNINSNHQSNQTLICDKIELVSSQTSSPNSLLPAPTNIRVK